MKDKILEILEKHLPEGYAYKHIAKELSQLMNKPTVDKAIIAKMEELIEKKGVTICHLVKIILRNASHITLRKWESDYIHKYPETWAEIEQELSALKDKNQ